MAEKKRDRTEYQKKYRANNLEKLTEYHKKYRAAHKEQISKTIKKYQEVHRKEILAKQRLRRLLKKERLQNEM